MRVSTTEDEFVRAAVGAGRAALRHAAELYRDRLDTVEPEVVDRMITHLRPTRRPRRTFTPQLHGDDDSLSARRIAGLVNSRQVDPSEIIAEFRQRARSRTELRAFITDGFDSTRSPHSGGPLVGIPVGAKDVIDVEGMPTTGGFAELVAQPAKRSAACVAMVERLGGLLVGKLNTSELSTFPSGENLSFGTALNPVVPDRIPGGSSSGSAVALAAGLVAASIGADTGGSVRVPAAACAVVGLKPTRGWISNEGVLPLAWSLDHIGLLTRDVLDAAYLLDALSETAVYDEAQRGAAEGIAGLIIGVPYEWIERYCDLAVRVAWEATQRRVINAGAELQPIQLPSPDDCAAVSRFIIQAEEAAWFQEQSQFEAVARSAIRSRKMIGLGYSAPEYLAARQVRAAMQLDLTGLLANKVDAIAMPTIPIALPRVDACHSDDPSGREIMRQLVLFTSMFSLCGMPTITVPSGLVAGAPAGVQFVTNYWKEGLLLRVAAGYAEAVA